jgi:hypothetical protein
MTRKEDGLFFSAMRASVLPRLIPLFRATANSNPIEAISSFVLFPFFSLIDGWIDLRLAFRVCTIAGCTMVFSRQFQTKGLFSLLALFVVR